MRDPESHSTPPAQVTLLLERHRAGDKEAFNAAFSLVYDELKKIANRLLRSERSDHTLQATELVHEAYLRLVDQTRCEWRNRAHFMAVASIAPMSRKAARPANICVAA